MGDPRLFLSSDAYVLIVALNNIGSLLLTTPALCALRETFPQAKIDVLATTYTSPLLTGWGYINNIIEYDKYGILDTEKFRDDLHNKHYDAVFIMGHLVNVIHILRYKTIVQYTDARWKIGLDNGRGSFFNVVVKDNGFGFFHEADYYLALVEAVGAKTDNKRLVVPIQQNERKQAHYLVHGNKSSTEEIHPIIAFHPGSSNFSHARRWPPEHFAQLADILFQHVGGQLLLIGSSEERELHEQIVGLMKSPMPVCSLAGKCDIRVTAAVLELIDLFVGNDSGPMHLAAAIGAPTVAIFGLSNYKAWGPYSTDKQHTTIVHLDLPCMPCLFRGHQIGMRNGCTSRDCLTNLGTDIVADAALKMLQNSSE